VDLVAQSVMKAATFLETYVDYPPSQAPASFSVDDVVTNVKAQIARLKQQGQNNR
jgi:hypothetical protein